MRLSELRNAMSGYATRFDAALVSAHDAVRVVDDAAVIEKMAATVKTLAAARVAETELWKCDGDRSAAHQLARTTGTSVGAANEALESARRLRELPATEAAARRGELSAQQVATITDAVAADPDAEARLLEQSRTRSLAELRDECARAEKPTRRAKILARVDLPALLRGHPVGDEICEFAGYGPVAVSAIRDLIDTRDPFLVAIATNGKAVVGVAHVGRRPNAHQHSALEWLYPTCAVEGCNSVAFLEKRPPRELGRHPHDCVRAARPALHASPRAQDHRAMGTRRRSRQKSVRTAR